MAVVAIVALVVALLVGGVVTIVVPVLCCLVCHYRRELHVVKSQVSRLEYGLVTSSNSAPGSPQDNPPTSPPPSSPGANDTLKLLTQSSSDKPPQRASGYSAVNLLGVLPEEVRTPENLEGSTIPIDQAQKLVDSYLKERQDYEERQLKQEAQKTTTVPESQQPHVHQQQQQNSGPSVLKQPTPPTSTKHIPTRVPGYEDIPGFDDDPPPPSSVPSPPRSGPTPRYEDIPEPLSRSAPVSKKSFNTDEYVNPSDAVHNSEVLKSLKGGKQPIQNGGNSSPKDKKKFQLSNGTNDEEYTVVFDNLPAGEAARVGQRKSARAMSDSSPDRKPLRENNNPSPSSLHNADVEVANSSAESSPVLRERNDSTRKSNRHSDKEVVEFNPTRTSNKKMFRVTSTKKTKSANGKDSPDGTMMDEAHNGASPGPSSPSKAQEFEISEENSESYAVVNLADKKKYRAEADVVKKEGSGIPDHYKPPVKSEAEAITAM